VRLACVLLLLALGCGAPPLQAGRNGVPGLLIAVRPDRQVMALDLLPAPGGLRLAGRIESPQPLLAAARPGLAEGLDDAGAVLFRCELPLLATPAATRRGGPVPALLRAELPWPAGLRTVRVTLPAP
jgi:hypothetical protein